MKSMIPEVPLQPSHPPRPRRTDQRVLEATAKELAAEVAEWCGDGTDHDTVVAHLVGALRSAGPAPDSYQIAKYLDDHHHYDPDEGLLDILSGASTIAWRAHDAVVRAWVAENGITPTIEVGSLVMTKRNGGGEIVGIRVEDGCYLVQTEEFVSQHGRKEGSGLIIAFEDCEPAPSASEAGQQN